MSTKNNKIHGPTIRFSGFDIPANKSIVISLQYIVGIGHTIAKEICKISKIDEVKKSNTLSQSELDILSKTITQMKIKTGDYVTDARLANVKACIALGPTFIKGYKHIKNLPQNGRTKNRKTARKGIK